MKLLIPLFLLLPVLSLAQSFTLSGTVTDAEGTPLVGASVYDIVNQTGTVADLDGRYQLEVTVGTELQFSYVGNEAVYWFVGPEKPTAHNVALEQGLYLDEVVVTASSTITNTYRTNCSTSCFVECLYYVGTPKESSSATAVTPPLSPLQAATVFPNPFVSHLAVDIQPTAPTTLSAVLLDVTGRVVRSWPARQLAPGASTETYRIGTARLLPGLYLLRLTDQDGRTEVRKVRKAYGG